MGILIERSAKIMIVRLGPVRTFGEYEVRQKMSDDQLVEVFDRAWAGGLQAAASRSHSCTIDVARSKLKESYKTHLDPQQEQRQFRYQEIDFILQWKPLPSGDHELTQLWKVQSGDDHPKTLWVTFETIEERKLFGAIAREHGWKDEELGLELVRDFMRKIKQIPPTL